MISRLTTFAAIFAVLTTTTLALAATSVQQRQATAVQAAIGAAATPVVQFETVVITGRRQPGASAQ